MIFYSAQWTRTGRNETDSIKSISPPFIRQIQRSRLKSATNLWHLMGFESQNKTYREKPSYMYISSPMGRFIWPRDVPWPPYRHRGREGKRRNNPQIKQTRAILLLISERRNYVVKYVQIRGGAQICRKEIYNKRKKLMGKGMTVAHKGLHSFTRRVNPPIATFEDDSPSLFFYFPLFAFGGSLPLSFLLPQVFSSSFSFFCLRVSCSQPRLL